MIHITQPEFDINQFSDAGYVSTANIMVTEDAQKFGFDLRPRADPPKRAQDGANAVSCVMD